MTDWIKGFPFAAYNLLLANGYAIHISVNQHHSGKVTIRQSVTKTGVVFGDLDTTFMNKLNKALLKVKEVSS